MRAIVRGRVQGVGFRAFAQHEAERLGLRGYARNLYDGRVEVVAVGPQDNLDRFSARLRTGPPGSRVEGIDRSVMDPPPELERFEIRPTALGSPGGRGSSPQEKP